MLLLIALVVGDFLSILSEIERNYLLDDSGDANSSADGMATLG
jgi:hypothetical protein